jgi:CO dehydrogenase flavoprotein C-terminal domain
MERGTVKDVRIALGGVAHKPWRAQRAEAALRGGPATEAAFRQAAEAELAAAQGFRDNSFKIELARRLIADTLGKLQQPMERRDEQGHGASARQLDARRQARSADPPQAGPDGAPILRIDGPLKVSGKAQFCAEFPMEGLTLRCA